MLEPTAFISLEQPPASVTHFNRTDMYLIFHKITTIKLNLDINYLLNLRPDFANTISYPVVTVLIFV